MHTFDMAPENNVEDESMSSRKRRRTAKATPQDAPQRTSGTSVSEPLADWTPHCLVNNSTNFQHVHRISASLSPEELIERVLEHEESGIPLIVEGIHQQPNWDPTLFSLDGFIGDDDEEVDVRNIETSTDLKMSVRGLVDHYLAVLKNGKNDNKLYGKDVRHPPSWEFWLRNSLPEHFHPYSEKSDLTSCLDEGSRPESLMCYIGIGDTFTAAHKDLCGSFGHNLMCHTTEGGSAFWFMTASGALDDDSPSEYFRTTLNHELERENHVATLKEFRGAPFNIYVAEQRLGDFVLVPPRSCHQVVNRGGITLKMSWSRMGVKSVEYSLRSELPRYHRICRRETYRVKLTLYAAVKNYCRKLSVLREAGERAIKERKEVENTLWRLLPLLDEVLVEEWSPEHDSFTHTATDEDIQESQYCDFCGADIFQSFFSCTNCSEPESVSEYICCPTCCIEGRSCPCGLAIMKPSQTWHFDHLIQERNKAADMLSSQGHREIGHVSYDTLNTSEHLQIFKAACLLRKRKQGWSGSREPIRRCVPSKAGEQTHETLCSNSLKYGRNHVYKCYLHILKLFNMHAAEAILIDEQNGTALEACRNVESRSLAELLARTALTYDVCAPVDPTRYKSGFYDKHVLIPPPETALPSSQADHARPNLAINAHEQVQNGVPSHETKAPYEPNVNQAVSKFFNVSSDSPLSSLPEGDEDYNDKKYISPIKLLSIIPSPKKPEVFIPSFKRKSVVSSDSTCIAKRVRIDEPEPVIPVASPVPMSDQDLLLRRKRVSLTVIPTGPPLNRSPVREENSGRGSMSLRKSNRISRPDSNAARTDILAHVPTPSATPLKGILKSPSKPTRIPSMARSRSNEPDLMVRTGSSSKQAGRHVSQSDGMEPNTDLESGIMRKEEQRQLNILLKRTQKKEKMLEKMLKKMSEIMRKQDEDFKRKNQELEDSRKALDVSIRIFQRHVASSSQTETHGKNMGRIVEHLESQGSSMHRNAELEMQQHQENRICHRAAEEDCQSKTVWSDDFESESINYSNNFDVDLSRNSPVEPPEFPSIRREDHTTSYETVGIVERRAPFNNGQTIERHTTTEARTVTQEQQKEYSHLSRFQGESTPKGPSGWQQKQLRDGSTQESHRKFYEYYRRDSDFRPRKRRNSLVANPDEYRSGSMAEGSQRNGKYTHTLRLRNRDDWERMKQSMQEARDKRGKFRRSRLGDKMRFPPEDFNVDDGHDNDRGGPAPHGDKGAYDSLSPETHEVPKSRSLSPEYEDTRFDYGD